MIAVLVAARPFLTPKFHEGILASRGLAWLRRRKLSRLRWSEDGVRSPRCGSSTVRKIATRRGSIEQVAGGIFLWSAEPSKRLRRRGAPGVRFAGTAHPRAVAGSAVDRLPVRCRSVTLGLTAFRRQPLHHWGDSSVAAAPSRMPFGRYHLAGQSGSCLGGCPSTEWFPWNFLQNSEKMLLNSCIRTEFLL
jgi:hypothetical protein